MMVFVVHWIGVCCAQVEISNEIAQQLCSGGAFSEGSSDLAELEAQLEALELQEREEGEGEGSREVRDLERVSERVGERGREGGRGVLQFPEAPSHEVAPHTGESDASGASTTRVPARQHAA